GRGESGHQADEKGSKAHHRERDQEGILAAYQVAYSSEEERPKRAHHESNGEGSEIGDVGKGGVPRRVEFQGENCGETSENIEVVPLDHGSHGRGKNHSPDVGCGGTTHWNCVCTAGHASSCEVPTSS